MSTLVQFPQVPLVDQDGRIALAWREWLQNPQIVTLVLQTALGVDSGGTGLTSGTPGGLLAFSASTTAQSTAAGTSHQVLHGNGTAVPTFGAVDIATEVSNLGAGVATFLQTPSTANLSSCLTVADEGSTAGINSQSANYTTVLADTDRTILHPASDNNPRTFTIDSNANVSYGLNTMITFVNLINTVTIAITSDTLILAGPGSTGSRTLSANGIATAVKIAATTWVITGTNLL